MTSRQLDRHEAAFAVVVGASIGMFTVSVGTVAFLHPSVTTAAMIEPSASIPILVPIAAAVFTVVGLPVSKPSMERVR